MASVLPEPSHEDLQRFLLGQLDDADIARIEQWLDENPSRGDQLSLMAAADTMTEALALTLHSDVPTTQEADALARRALDVLSGAQVLATDAMPERLGGYRVVRVLGAGGMGVVYEAIDEALQRKVALKVLRGEKLRTAEARTRFLREARAAAALKSDYIVTVYQVAETDGVPYLAMEFLEGQTLEDWLRGQTKPPSVADVIRVAREVLTGLAVAHDKGVIHRDIKPQNLWLDADTGRVKILDFGLARDVSRSDGLTCEGAVMGTPAYMAPEQASGKPVDVRADLFSVGVVLYRMLAGQSPFARGGVLATETPAAVETLAVGVPAGLARFIGRLVAKDPADRPANVRAALAELNALERTAPATPPRKPWPWGRIAAALLGFGLLLAGIIITIKWRTPDGKEGMVEVAIKGKDDPATKEPPAPEKIRVGEPLPGQPKDLFAVIGEPRQSGDYFGGGTLLLGGSTLLVQWDKRVALYDLEGPAPRLVPDPNNLLKCRERVVGSLSASANFAGIENRMVNWARKEVGLSGSTPPDTNLRAWSAFGKIVASVNERIELFLSQGGEKSQHRIAEIPVKAELVAFVPSTEIRLYVLVSQGGTYRLHHYEVAQGQARLQNNVDTGLLAGSGVPFVATSSRLLVIPQPDACYIWTLGDDEPAASIKIPVPGIRVARLGARDAVLAFATEKTFGLYDLKQKRIAHEWKVPFTVTNLAFASDGRHLVTSNDNGTVYILRFPEGK